MVYIYPGSTGIVITPGPTMVGIGAIVVLVGAVFLYLSYFFFKKPELVLKMQTWMLERTFGVKIIPTEKFRRNYKLLGTVFGFIGVAWLIVGLLIILIGFLGQ